MACVYVGGGGERGNYVSVMGSCMCIECVCGRGEINTKCARTVVTHLQKLWLLARGPLVRTDEPFCCEGMEQKELVSLSPSPHQGPSKSVASNTCDLIGQCKHIELIHQSQRQQGLVHCVCNDAAQLLTRPKSLQDVLVVEGGMFLMQHCVHQLWKVVAPGSNQFLGRCLDITYRPAGTKGIRC